MVQPKIKNVIDIWSAEDGFCVLLGVSTDSGRFRSSVDQKINIGRLAADYRWCIARHNDRYVPDRSTVIQLGLISYMR